MIDETELGVRDAKGHWVPNRRNDFGPLFSWPTKPLAIAKWFVTGAVAHSYPMGAKIGPVSAFWRLAPEDVDPQV